MNKIGIAKKIILAIYYLIYSFYLCLTDFDLMYYVLYIAFALLGLLLHPFFFAFHLSNFLRIGVLTSVVKAIWIPRKQLFLTFVFFILIEYYFTIIGYSFLWMHYNEFCSTMFRCFIVTFDYTFKETGAIGVFLQDPQSKNGTTLKDDENYPGLDHKYLSKFIGRFIFDNLFNIFLVLIVINMVAGNNNIF